MRQDGNRAAAPLNAEPRWPEGYIRALREAGAQEKTILYCVGWVRRFFAENPGRRRRDLGRAEVEAFLSGLVARPGATNWQIQQARDSLELYYEQFRGIALAPRPDIPVTHARPPPVAQAIPPPPPARKPPAADAPPPPTVAISCLSYESAARGVKTNVRPTAALPPWDGRRQFWPIRGTGWSNGGVCMRPTSGV